MAKLKKVYSVGKGSKEMIVCFAGNHYSSPLGTKITLDDKVEIECPGKEEDAVKVTAPGKDSEFWPFKACYVKKTGEEKKREKKASAAPATGAVKKRPQKEEPEKPKNITWTDTAAATDAKVFSDIAAVVGDRDMFFSLKHAYVNWQRDKKQELFQGVEFENDPDATEKIRELGKKIMEAQR